MSTHYIGDTAVLTGRSLRHILRRPDTIITTAIMPIAMLLLFVFVLGERSTRATLPTLTTCCPASCSLPSLRESRTPRTGCSLI